MLNLEDVKKYLDDNKKWYISDVQIRASDGSIVIYVPSEHIAEKAGKRATSIRQLNNLARRLKERYATDVVVVHVQSESHQEMEESLQKLLNHRFDNLIASLFFSYGAENIADFWIELNSTPDQLEDEVRQNLEKLLEPLELALGQIYWLHNHAGMLTVPTLPAMLRLVKANQPVSIEKLVAELGGEDHVKKQKIAHTLDVLRKKGLVVWQKPGTYSLTSKGLSATSAGLSRSSSDIGRALALGRWKW